MVDLTAIINAVIALVMALVSAFLIPWIKSKTTEKQRQIMLTVAETAVKAAEQMYKGSGRGAEKKAYVLQYMNDHGYTADLAAIEAAVEAEVLKLNIAS